MNVKSSAAVLMILLGANSFASAADPSNTPANGLLFPESVERAMIGQAAATAVNISSGLTESTTSWGFEKEIKGPIDLLIEKSNLPAPAPIRALLEEPFVPFTPAAAPDPKDYAELEKAMQLLANGKPKEAMQKLHGRQPNLPKFTSALVVMYYTFARADRPKIAYSALEKAIVEYPNDPEPWTILGQIALQENRNGEAELDFVKAKQLLPGCSDNDHKKLVECDMTNGMAQVAECREQWHEAETRLVEYLKKSPDDLEGWRRLGRAQFAQALSTQVVDKQLIAKAHRSLQHAKQIDNRDSKKNHTPERILPAAAILAQFYDSCERRIPFTGPSKNAKEMFLYALKYNPGNPKLRYVVGIWALENGETELAEEQAKELLGLDAKGLGANAANSDALMLNGIVALWKKHWAVAQDYFEKVLIVEPNRFDVSNYLALALVEQKVAAKQARALDLAYANFQNNKDGKNAAEAAATLSWVYYRMGEFKLASAAWDAEVRADNAYVTKPDSATYAAFIFDHNDNGHNGLNYRAKQIIEAQLGTGYPFRMKSEAEELYEKLKDVKAP